ncbi:MAG: hypothetical protein ACPGVU_10770, partial [Limisphaerales bacterium]
RLVEKIKLTGTGVVERVIDTCGDYTAHCEMADGSRSQACEFAICDLGFTLSSKPVPRGKPWEIKLSSDNMNAIIVYFKSLSSGYDEHNVFITEEDRKNGKVTIPASVIAKADRMQIWLVGENRYGRLKQRQDVTIAY